MSHWAESCLVLSSFFLTLSYGYVSLSRRVFILSFLSLDSSTWFRLAFFSSLSMLPFLAFPSRKILIFNRWAWTTRSSLEKCFFEQRKRTSLKKQRLKKTWRVITRSSTSVQFDEEEQRQERDSRQTRHPSSSSFCLIESLWFFSSYSSSGLVLASFCSLWCDLFIVSSFLLVSTYFVTAHQETASASEQKVLLTSLLSLQSSSCVRHSLWKRPAFVVLCRERHSLS